MSKPYIHFNDEMVVVKITPEQLRNYFNPKLRASERRNIFAANPKLIIDRIAKSYKIRASIHLKRRNDRMIGGKVVPFKIEIVMNELHISEKVYETSQRRAWRFISERVFNTYSKLIVYKNNLE